MKSNGGVISADEVVHQPITTVLSGPAAGALGAALVAGEAGYDRILTLDGGGTSTDVSVVLGGQPTLTTEGSVGRFPSKIPMIDIVTVGAGGGSIAWVSPEGTLKVGPRSAGADPGPRCYGKGGTEPTVTDAHLVLGRIPPHLLGGEVPLDRERRSRASRRWRRRSVWGPRTPPAASSRSRPGTRPTPSARSP
jgi:N-methylhydantoinase A